jgi:hypothetical protein
MAAALGFIARSGLHPSMLVVTLPMMVLGLYGAFACLKFHERCAFHVGQARGLRKKIAISSRVWRSRPRWGRVSVNSEDAFPD